MATQIISGAESFSIGTGKKGLILIHGWTSSPREMRPVAEVLKEHYVCVAPLLGGHGTNANDLTKWRWPAHLKEITDVYDDLIKKVDSISVCGLSYGCLLALHLCLARKIEKVALLAPFFSSTSTFLGLAQSELSRYCPPLPIQIPKSGAGPIFNPQQNAKHIAYPTMPLPALRSVANASHVLQQNLPAITIPVLAIHSRLDRTASYTSAQNAFQSLGSRDKKWIALEKSNHIITLDIEQEKVLQEICSFLNPA